MLCGQLSGTGEVIVVCTQSNQPYFTAERVDTATWLQPCQALLTAPARLGGWGCGMKGAGGTGMVQHTHVSIRKTSLCCLCGMFSQWPCLLAGRENCPTYTQQQIHGLTSAMLHLHPPPIWLSRGHKLRPLCPKRHSFSQVVITSHTNCTDSIFQAALQ